MDRNAELEEIRALVAEPFRMFKPSNRERALRMAIDLTNSAEFGIESVDEIVRIAGAFNSFLEEGQPAG